MPCQELKHKKIRSKYFVVVQYKNTVQLLIKIKTIALRRQISDRLDGKNKQALDS